MKSNNFYQTFYPKEIWSLLQSVTTCYYIVWQLSLLQSATAILLQSTTSVITKCDKYYKVWQFYYEVRQVLLQSATKQISGHITNIYFAELKAWQQIGVKNVFYKPAYS